MDLMKAADDLPAEMLVSADRHDETRPDSASLALTFEGLLTGTDFVEQMRRILAVLQDAYGCPVDMEYAVNFMDNGEYRINVVQCRPLQVKGSELQRLPVVEIAEESKIIEARGAIIGQSRDAAIDRFIYVVPSVYSELPTQDRYEVARLIGKINRAGGGDSAEAVMLLGPGRWGTSTPALGVPVSFNEINRVSILCEIVAMREDLVPDVSLGTHFLSELVEVDMLYLALFPNQKGNRLNREFFENSTNRLGDLVRAPKRWERVVRVIDVPDGGPRVRLLANAQNQKVVCFFDDH
jgi:hypothetical protein